MTMWSRGFWADLGERALSTFAQSLVASLLLIGAGTQSGLVDVDWVQALSIAGAATLLSVLKGIGANYVEPKTGASLNTGSPEVDPAP